ncbi:transposase [Enterobacter mori]|uniref:transposase n=1 Tax=Enterobacter mori TaxID=539813 RepID=UPI003B83F3C1
MSEQKITVIVPAKTNFYLLSINAYGKPAKKFSLSRNSLLNWLVQRPGITVTVVACGAFHHLARES